MSNVANSTISATKLVNAPPKLKKRKLYSPTPKQVIGQTGEHLAVEFLKQKGYQILLENFLCKYGEIDIVAQDEEELVFVEVKTRNTDFFGHPSEAVTPSKLKKIIRTAEYYLTKTGKENFYRFDIISILPDKLEHFENVTME